MIKIEVFEDNMLNSKVFRMILLWGRRRFTLFKVCFKKVLNSQFLSALNI